MQRSGLSEAPSASYLPFLFLISIDHNHDSPSSRLRNILLLGDLVTMLLVGSEGCPPAWGDCVCLWIVQTYLPRIVSLIGPLTRATRSEMGGASPNQLIDRSRQSEYIVERNECVISDDESSVYIVVAELCLWQVCTCDSVTPSIKLLGFITPELLDLHRPLLSPYAPISCSPGPCLLALLHVTAWLSLQIVRRPLNSCERIFPSPSSLIASNSYSPSIIFSKRPPILEHQSRSEPKLLHAMCQYHMEYYAACQHHKLLNGPECAWLQRQLMRINNPRERGICFNITDRCLPRARNIVGPRYHRGLCEGCQQLRSWHFRGFANGHWT